MKLNEFKQVDEVNLSHVIGDYGASGLKQIGNRLMGNAEGQLSVKDKMAKEKFIADFIGRANTNLNSAIKSGLVNPSLKSSGTTPATTPATTPTTTPATTPTTTQSVPSNTANTSTTATSPTTPETPEQKRIRLQKLAQQTADKEGMPFSKLPGNQPKVQAGNIRQQKQAVAAKNAQSQMTPFSKLPANQTGIQAANIRKQKQGVATQNAQATMTPKPAAPATETPAQKRIRLQQLAAQNAQAQMKEGKFYKLDALFESIVEAGEPQAQSISDYLQNMFKQYMKGKVRDPQSLAQLKKIADETQASYPSIKQGLNKLANLAFATSYSQGNATSTSDAGVSTATKPAGFFSGLAQGAGLSQGATTQPTTTPTPNAVARGAETQPATEPAQVKQDTPYKQAVSLLGKLDKKGKQRILKYLDKQLGVSSPTTEPSADKAEPSAFGNMARQLDTMGQKNSSTGGTTTPTGRGVRHTASPTNPNQAPALDKKIDIANKRTRKQPAKV